jgi:hypothetical protein
MGEVYNLIVNAVDLSFETSKLTESMMNVYEKTIIPGMSVAGSNIVPAPEVKLFITENNTISTTGKAIQKR